MIEVDGVRVFRIDGKPKLYSMLPKQEEVFQDENWSLHATVPERRAKPAGKKTWANCRLYRLTGAMGVFHLGVDLTSGRLADTSCRARLDAECPGITEWAVACFMASRRGDPPPHPPSFDQASAAQRPPATKVEEMTVVDFIRARQGESQPLSQRRVTRRAMRYVGDEVEYRFGIPEPIVFEATRKMLLFGVVEDVVMNARTKMRGLRVNEFAYAEYFGASTPEENCSPPADVDGGWVERGDDDD